MPLKAQSVSSLMSILRLSILCTCLFDGHRRTGLNGCRFPLFHRPSFEEKLNQNEHLKDTGLFTSTMAACALASARARDGALFSLLDSGVGCALSSSTVISSSEADSTVKEIFAALLRGAILFCRESLVRAGSWVCGGMGAGVACKHTTLASLPNTALLPPKTQPDLHQQGQCCAWRKLA